MADNWSHEETNDPPHADRAEANGVLCAEGRNFTAGLELNQVAKHLAEGPLFSANEVDPVNLHGRLRTKPLVAAVQGICFTLGIELMLASDIVAQRP
jgi:enoyl-CoA hydratase/carnithine racemase